MQNIRIFTAYKKIKCASNGISLIIVTSVFGQLKHTEFIMVD